MGIPPKSYLNAYSSLYGNTLSKPTVRKRSSTTRKRQHPEQDEQVKLCTWMTTMGILYYAIPNGGYRHKLEAFNLKRAGVKGGVPDICIPIAAWGYHALYIELKASGGIVSNNQQYWIKQLNNKGNLAKVCYGAEEAKSVIENYLGIKCSM